MLWGWMIDNKLNNNTTHWSTLICLFIKYTLIKFHSSRHETCPKRVRIDGPPVAKTFPYAKFVQSSSLRKFDTQIQTAKQ